MRKVIKISLYIVGSVLLVLLSAIIMLNTQWGQNFVRVKAEAFLHKKLHTEVRIGHLGYGLPKYIVLNDVFLGDEAKDTLLSVNTLKIDLAMLELLHNKLDVQLMILNGVHAHVYRNRNDSNFNYTYIINAFAGNQTASQPKDTTSSFAISVDKLVIDDIHAHYDDHEGGTLMTVDLDHLALSMRRIELRSMLFHIQDLNVAGLHTSYEQDTSYVPVTTKIDNKNQLQIVADHVHLQHIDFNYNDKPGKLQFAVNLGTLQLELKKFDLLNNIIDINKLAVNSTAAKLLMGKPTNPASSVTDSAAADNKSLWHINATGIDLGGLAFKMDDERAPHTKKGIDYAHLDIQGLALKLTDLKYSTDSISGNIQHLAVKEKCGVIVQELKTKFNYDLKGVTLKDLYVLTPHTVIQDHMEVHYAPLRTLKDDPGNLQLNIDLSKSLIGIEDILAFAPQLTDQDIFRKYPKAQIRVDARINGQLNNMNIARLYVLSMNNTEVELNGKITGLPEPKNIHYNFHINKLQSSRKEVEDWVPASALTSVRIPDRFGLSGNVSGTIQDHTTDIVMVSTDGTAYVKGSLFMSPGKGKEVYDIRVQTNKLNVGRILHQDTLLGEISATLNAQGTGFDMKTMSAGLSGAISSASAKNYLYHDIVFNGSVNRSTGNITLSSADKNLRLHMTAIGDFSKKDPAIKADIQLDSIDLQALHLYTTELRARGTIHADFPILNADYPTGTFTWKKPIINADGRRYYPDSMYITSAPDETKGQDITAYFDALSFRITGKTPLSKIGAILGNRISQKYTPPVADTNAIILANTTTNAAKNKPPKDTTTLPEKYELSMSASLVDKPMLHSIIPGLTEFDSIRIDGKLDEKNLLINIDIPRLVYGSNTIYNGAITVNGTDSELSYMVTSDKISSGRMDLYYADLRGNVEQNLITAHLKVADSLKKPRFAIAAEMAKKGDEQIITLQQGMMLNYNNWKVSPENKIVLTHDGYYVQQLELSNNNQYIKANSEAPSADAKLKIDITNFLLSNITSIVNAGDTVLANGILGATASLQKTSDGGQNVTGDMVVMDLSIMGDTLGALSAQINNKTGNTLDTKITLKGFENDITVNGYYYLTGKDGNDFDLKMNIKALAAKSFQGLAMGQVNNSSGFVRGNLDMTGTIAAPKINGTLKTDELRTTVTSINSKFRFPAETIEFADDIIKFNKFNILDGPDNKATIDGTVNMHVMTDPEMNLKIKAGNWTAMHSTAKDNSSFYGDLVLTTDLDIKGTPSAPVVDGTLNILKGTNMTIVTPEKTPEIESRKGIVKFVNSRNNGRENLLIPKKKDTTGGRKMAKGSDINVNVVVDKSAQFSLIIDQASGDFISVRGDASLNASVAPGGTIGLTGNYALHDGAYQLNYNFIKRKFKIKDGSNITFAGDPIKGTNMDITAVYEATVPPYDLVQRQVADQAALNYYKQRIPFAVDLHLKGPVLQPGINFDLSLPDDKVYPLSSDQIEVIQGKLSQVRTDTSELNKQVFAILILNRFVSDDPFSSQASSSVGFTALQSVSTFIGEQLNQAANKLIKGVDLSVDLATSEDYTSGSLRQKTNLNVAASKRLLDDRLKLTVGNNFELEGAQTTTQQTNYVPTNLAADYLLTSDGRYTVRGYRKSYDEGVLQGYVTETGVNFIVSLDYNNFKNIFRKNKKDTTTNK